MALWYGADAPPMRPFWRFFGGKFRSALLYPQPKYDHVIESFAGSAGYALRYPDLKVTLVEKYNVLAEIWRYLIGATQSEILSIPICDHVDDLPVGLPDGARNLVRMCFGAALAGPVNQTTSGVRRNREKTDKSAGWSVGQRARIARQVDRIRHWVIIEGDYSLSPIIARATYFIDPPYVDKGKKYRAGPRGSVEERTAWYAELGSWCRDLPGQVIVCENAGATWLPFRPFGQFRKGFGAQFNERPGSREVIWLNEWENDV
jgi:hypothetical protein